MILRFFAESKERFGHLIKGIETFHMPYSLSQFLFLGWVVLRTVAGDFLVLAGNAVFLGCWHVNINAYMVTTLLGNAVR